MRDTLVLLLELVALFFGVSFAVQLFQRRMGEDRLRAWMGGPPPIAALKGIAVGFVTPFCTFTAIPMLVGFRKADVTPAGYVAFIVAAPVLDPVLFGALVVIVGLTPALVYAAVAFTAAMALALLAELVDMSRHLKELPVPRGANPIPTPALVGAPSGPVDRAVETCGLGQERWRGIRVESGDAARDAAALLRSFGPLLLVGIAIGLGIEAFVSPDTVARITGDNSLYAIPVASLLGTPLYFSTELFVPIADALRGAGVGIGAIVALTIAGAGANIPEFVILSRLARARLIAIFALYVFGVAMGGGLLAEAFSG